MTIVRDPLYRYYNANLQTPRLKCEELYVKTLNATSWTQNGVVLETGDLPFATVFNISPECLADPTCCGELTLYLKNEGQKMSAVVMNVVTKAGGTLSPPVTYQNVGNFTTVTLTTPNASTVRVTIAPGGICKWIWRGI